jgi:hypothetical protein
MWRAFVGFALVAACTQGQPVRSLLLPEARHITGVVLDQDGKPVDGARIDHTADGFRAHATDADGKFAVDTKAPLIVIRKAGYRSEIVRTKEAVSDVQIILQKLDAIFLLCTNSAQREGLQGWGAMFRFVKVPGVIASNQGQDIDYGSIVYYVNTKQGPKGINHGSGPLWSFGQPLDSDVWPSVKYSETTFQIGAFTIIDSRGELPDGTRWRNLGKFGETASYRNADEDSAKVLDQFLDGACLNFARP